MRSKRSLGQNFLSGSHYPKRIVNSLSPQPGETIIEIGPGHGALTGLLIESGARVLAVEIDRELIAPLAERFGEHKNFYLIEADALEVDFCDLITPATTARVLANLPYYIATPILERLIENRTCLHEMVLMLQREMVDRITAVPGGKEYGYFSIFVQYYCETEKLFDVPPGAFRPAPKVYSSVVRLQTRRQQVVTARDEKFFTEVIRVLFSQRRKTIVNNLRAGRSRLGIEDESVILRVLDDLSIDPRRRAETLSIAEIVRLSNAIMGEQ